MKVNQGLLNWLNADKNNNLGTSLLLAPVNVNPKNSKTVYNSDALIKDPEHNEQEYIPEYIHELITEDPEPEIESDIEPDTEPEDIEPEDIEPEIESKDSHNDKPDDNTQSTDSTDENNEPALNEIIGIPEDVKNHTEEITNELQELKKEVASIQSAQSAQSAQTETHEAAMHSLNKAWHEASAGFELSMNEPPPQLWTSQSEIESEDEDSENEYEEDYEHIILSQSSNLTLHGTNFTQRLQKILQGRKNKAAELRRKNSEKNKHSHPYIRHGFMMCFAVLLALGLAWSALAYLRAKTPDGFSTRASKLYDQGKYDEAMNVYQEAYRKYPDNITFLEGIAKSAEKAGHSQTAFIAREEYNNAFPKVKSEDIKPAAAPVTVSQPIKININTGGGKKENKKEPEAKSGVKSATKEEAKVPAFDEYLSEANRLYNIGMYTKALENFFKALEMRNDDIRPYIGIAESYRAKGMYPDAIHILRQARSKFGINPTIETLRQLLRRNTD